MIIFDKGKYVKDIVTGGIHENDPGARAKIFLVAKYYLQETQYKRGRIIEILHHCAANYFKGLSKKLVDDIILDIYDAAKNKSGINESRAAAKSLEADNVEDIDLQELNTYFKPKELILYEAELERICQLEDKLQELAFAFLVVNKFLGYKWIYECNSDVFRICKQDKKKSGATKNDMIHKLVKEKILSFYCNVNNAYKFDKRWIAKTSVTVLINQDNYKLSDEKRIFCTITNFDDVMLYLRLYKGDESIKLCAGCGCPIEATNNAKRYCSDCARINKRESKKRNRAKMPPKAC